MEKLHADDNFIDQDVSSFWDFKGKFDFVDNWFLMDSPYLLLVITIAYLLFVLKLGPDYMKTRKPFKLKNILLLYNIIQVGLSTWMFFVALEVMMKVGLIQRTCMTDTFESKHRLATITYYYFACKISELMDTVLFVLRKKQNQVTFLHVYHHSMMVWNGWCFLKYEPGYWMVFLGVMNCFVHMVMYTYYGLSAYPSLHKYLWWKKYITSMQLLQFGLLLVVMTISLFVNECKPSRLTVIYFYFNTMLFIYLFSRFYIRSYTPEKSKEINNSVNNNKSKLNKNDKDKVTRQKNDSAKKNCDHLTNGLKTHTNTKIE